MSSNLDLNRLRVLDAVARTGSVTGAARALHYAQASVSHHLARLEAEAGIALLHRVGRGVRLTEAGEILAGRAAEILGRVEGAQRELDALAGLRAGRARLAAFPSALATLVPAAITSLARDLPGVSVGLVEAEPPEAVAALVSGAVDVALTFDHPDVPHSASVKDLSRFEVTPLLSEPVFVVHPADDADAPGHLTADDDGRRAAPGTDLARLADTRRAAPSSELARLADADWIAGCERCRADLVARCSSAGFAPRITFETDDFVAVQALVAAGAGISLLPALALHAHRHPRVRVEPLPGASRRILALTVGPPTPPARELIARLVAAAAAAQP